MSLVVVGNRHYTLPSLEFKRLKGIVVGFGSAIKSGFKNYFKFTGRASRSEFWLFYLFFVLSFSAAWILTLTVASSLSANISDSNSAVGAAIFGVLALIFLAMVFPVFSLMFRRLHDSDKSAWFVLLYLIPFGGIVLFIFYCLPGTKGPNKHGPDPLASPGTVATVFE